MKDLQINNIFSSFLIEKELDFDHHAVTYKCHHALMTSDDYNQKNIFSFARIFLAMFAHL